MNLQKATPQTDKPPKFIGWLSADSEEIHTDTPHKVVSSLLDSDFDGEAADVVNKTIVWVRNLLARS